MQVVSLNIYVHKHKNILLMIINLEMFDRVRYHPSFFFAKSLLFSSKQETLNMCDSYESTPSVVTRIAFNLHMCALHTYGSNLHAVFLQYVEATGE